MDGIQAPVASAARGERSRCAVGAHHSVASRAGALPTPLLAVLRNLVDRGVAEQSKNRSGIRIAPVPRPTISTPPDLHLPDAPVRRV